MNNSLLLSMLATSILNGEHQVDAIADRTSNLLGRRWRWLRPLARRYLAAFANSTRPRHKDVVRFLREDLDSQLLAKLSVAHWLSGEQSMHPVRAAADWPVPSIPTVGDLAKWLAIELADLAWFADLKGLERKQATPRLRHYHYQILHKTSGAVRLIESPKPRLKQIQRKILNGILDDTPHHPAAHGFVKCRSTQSFAAPHVGRHAVLRMDVRDFFPSFSGARIQAIFRTMGYPETVADLLGGLCTNGAPHDVWKNPCLDANPADVREAQSLYAEPHLPQGAPTSPMLANLGCYRIDCRLTGLAEAAGAVYTRYADDLAFSGDAHFDRRLERFATHVAAILHQEGLEVHHRKTRIMRAGVRQHLAGLVTNKRLNVPRPDFDRLKATLTNCARLGPETQNRTQHSDFRSHLKGKISYLEMINPEKGRRLRGMLQQIKWPPPFGPISDTKSRG